VIFIRDIIGELRRLAASTRGRLVVLTGARQCGKSTLALQAFPDYPILGFDSPVERTAYERLSPAAFAQQYPRAVLDEIQKQPSFIGTVKAAADRHSHLRYVLLGSSQLLLMQRVRETLAGRVAILELFPFMLNELVLPDEGTQPQPARIRRLLTPGGPAAETLFAGMPVSSPTFARAQRWWDYYLHWGGMPALRDEAFSDADRSAWLRDYRSTYLQRDLLDIARLDKLEPFVRAQSAAAIRSAQPVNFAGLARIADVSPPTAKQFMQYLAISYQVVFIPAYHRNREKRLSKQPKLHFVDPGIRRAILDKTGEPDGAEFESAVVSEVVKQARTARLPVTFHHLRTSDGREIDLLIETPDSYVAIECKQTSKVANADFRHLRGLAALLDKPLRCSIVVSNDPAVQTWDARANLWAVPAPWLLT